MLIWYFFYCQASVLFFIIGGILSGYLSLSALHLSGTPLAAFTSTTVYVCRSLAIASLTNMIWVKWSFHIKTCKSFKGSLKTIINFQVTWLYDKVLPERSLHWPILLLFYAFFLLWSIKQRVQKNSLKRSKWHCIFAQRERVKLLSHPKKCYFHSPLEPFWLTMTSLTESFNTANTLHCMKMNKNERVIIQWRLLWKKGLKFG